MDHSLNNMSWSFWLRRTQIYHSFDNSDRNYAELICGIKLLIILRIKGISYMHICYFKLFETAAKLCQLNLVIISR